MSYCEFCGSKLEDSQVCSCTAAEQARAATPPPQPESTISAPPQPEAPLPGPAMSAPPQPEAPLPGPAMSAPPQPASASEVPEPAAGAAVSATGSYPPPQSAYPPPPQGAYQPPQGAYPPLQGAYPSPPQGAQQPVAYPPPPPGSPPQGGYPMQSQQSPYGNQPGYYGAPQPMQGPNQMQQTFGAVKNTLGSFIKDPYGMATQGGSLNISVSAILLGTQLLTFILLVWSTLNRIIEIMLPSVSVYYDKAAIKELRNIAWEPFDFEFWIKIIFSAAIGIVLLYLCILLTTKITRITINTKTLLSAQALSSIMMSAAFLVMMVVMLVIGIGDTGGAVPFYVLLLTLGSVSSLLLLEISLRGVMPEGVGNVTRLLSLTCSYAVTNMVTVILIGKLLEDWITKLMSAF